MSFWKPTGGVTDHGNLNGLADDDHPQYLLGTLGGQGTVHVVSDAGASLEIDAADGNDQVITLTENLTITDLVNAVNGTSVYVTLHFLQDATGGWTITWPASFVWPGDVEPTLESDANAWTTILIRTYDGATTVYGTYDRVGSGGTSADDDFIWKPLLDGDGAIVTDGDGDPTMGFAPA